MSTARMTTYYERLGVDRHADQDEIREAYLAARRRLRAQGVVDFRVIDEAYAVLGDQQRRWDYDEMLMRAGPQAAHAELLALLDVIAEHGDLPRPDLGDEEEDEPAATTDGSPGGRPPPAHGSPGGQPPPGEPWQAAPGPAQHQPQTVPPTATQGDWSSAGEPIPVLRPVEPTEVDVQDEPASTEVAHVDQPPQTSPAPDDEASGPRRRRVLAYLAACAVIGAAIGWVSGTPTPGPRLTEGACVQLSKSTGVAVPCDQAHDAQVSAVVLDPAGCPPDPAGHLALDDGRYGCLTTVESAKPAE